jgi:hypothetical protein
MALIVSPKQSPQTLLAEIKQAMQTGKIETWSVDSDGDFTHTPEQWKFKAWLRPKVDGTQLVFTILNPQNTAITKVVYGVYHGRFIEMLLNHFDDKFTDAKATALPARGDRVSPS